MAKKTFYYIRSDKNSDFLSDLKAGGSSIYSKREIHHLMEIKNLIQKLFDIHFIALIVSLFSIAILWQNKEARQKIPHNIVNGCLLLLAIVVILSVTISLKWNKFFLCFHKIFFTQGTYSFPYSFTIMQLFPPRFWSDTALAWLLLTLIEALILGGLMWRIKRR